jgi:chaperonin GroES
MGTEHSISSPDEVELIDDRIMVRYLEPEEVTKGGIYLPQTAVEAKKERVQASVVVNVGPGRFTSDGKREAMMDILPGDVVFHAQYLGWLLIIPDPETGDDKEYRIFGQHDIFGYKKVAPREAM